MSEPHIEETIDRTPWPVNRLSYQDLKATELDAIERLFTSRSDSPLLMKWVMQHKRGGGFHKRLLVISALRVWLWRSKKPMRTTIEQAAVYQIIHITKISIMRCTNGAGSHITVDSTLPSSDSSATTSIKIEFASSKGQGFSIAGEEEVAKLAAVHIDPGAHSESIVRLLQRQLHLLRFAFPSLPPVLFPPQCSWQEYVDKENVNQVGQDENLQEQFTAIASAYRAFCDDVETPYRDDVMKRLQECIRSTSCVDFRYCLVTPVGVRANQNTEEQIARSDGQRLNNYHDQGPVSRVTLAVLRCFGLGPPSRKTLLMRESLALARAIEHANCVDSIAVRQVLVKDAGVAALFQTLLSPTSNVSGIALNRVRLSSSSLKILQNVILQSTIHKNYPTQRKTHKDEKHRLRRLDLSFNRFSQKMSVELAVALELLPSGLELLRLEKCSLTEPASSLLLTSLGANTAFAGSLCELNLSGNHLGYKGTAALAAWLTGALTLRQLDVSRTALDMNVFGLALQRNSILGESALVHLDVSFNRMRSQASKALGSVLGKTSSLSTIVLRGMKCFHVARITVGQSTSDGSGSTLFRFQRTKRGALTTFHPRHSRGLKREYLRNILGPMFTNSVRTHTCMVDLSENNLRGKKAETLAQLLDASPPTAQYSLRIDHACLHDKSSLLLLHSIRARPGLQSLSLEGNGYVRRSVQRARVAEQVNVPGEIPECSLPQEKTTSLERAAAQVLSLILARTRSRDDGSLPPRLLHENAECRDPQASSSPSESNNSPSVSTSKLRELSLKSYSSFVFGTHTILAVVATLPFTSSLRVLDVTGNLCGDFLARALGRALPHNCSLRTLFWDDNWTSVDGFFAFYEGLFHNQSITMVQMPIQDTRRILERQKNPPREKLFSVLGKIFKVTERNQATVTQQCHEHNEVEEADLEQSRHRDSLLSSSNQECIPPQDERLEVSGRNEPSVKSRRVSFFEKAAATDEVTLRLTANPDVQDGNNVTHGESKHSSESVQSVPNLMPRCPSPDLQPKSRGSKTWQAAADLSSSAIYRSRYPSTMNSWDLGSGSGRSHDPHESIDFTAQWNELTALSSSFSLS